jgi:O-succinylbenzoate synthase
MDKFNTLLDLTNRPLSLYRFKLPFKHSLNFKGQHLNEREGYWLVTRNQQQQILIGEVCPLPGFSFETLDQCEQQLLAILAAPCNERQLQFNNIEFTSALLPSVSFAFSCLQQQIPYMPYSYNVDRLINNLHPAPILPTIPLLQGHAQAILDRYLQLDCPDKIKLKVARTHLDEDVNLIHQLATFNPKLQCRLDANQQWTAVQYTDFLNTINTQYIDYIEEPTPSLFDNIHISEKFNISIALDESILNEGTLPMHKNIKAIIIKPTLIGYPDRINALMAHAQSERLQVSISSSFESPIAINQLHHLAHHWQQTYQIEISLGLDTLHVYADDVLHKSEQLNGQDNPFLVEAECLWSH